jgi:hypothetical protein
MCMHIHRTPLKNWSTMKNNSNFILLVINNPIILYILSLAHAYKRPVLEAMLFERIKKLQPKPFGSYVLSPDHALCH